MTDAELADLESTIREAIPTSGHACGYDDAGIDAAYDAIDKLIAEIKRLRPEVS
jgi:hypothetical protein